MAKIEGVIYKVFERQVVLRGFAPIGDLAKISYKNEAYQRESDIKHKRDIIEFLDSGVYKYFPEITLASRSNNYEALLDDVGYNEDIKPYTSKHVPGLFIKNDYIPIRANRARHANYEVPNKKLLRVDGNHRLEPFDVEKTNELWNDIDRDKIAGIIVPYCIIFSSDEIGDQFESAIFNNINFKALPLKQEKNLQNIHDFLKDTEELKESHSLTMQLIDLCESNCFKGLPFLSPQNSEIDIYRTLCLKTAKLLLSQKEVLSKSEELNKMEKYCEKLENEYHKLREDLDTCRKDMKTRNKDADSRIIEEKNSVIEELSNNLEKRKQVKERCVKSITRLKSQVINFLNVCDNIDKIEIATQSLRPVYTKFKDGEYGNISMMAALIYYKLYDEAMFGSFVKWIINNGLNKLPSNDILPSHSADSLVLLFEQIYNRKKKEVFISMQFGDPQSEMIYEKVIQTISRFNEIHSLDIGITPIRIDQSVQPYAFSIPEEILRAIDSSSLIIADLSSANINVYHEVGYAMGIAKEKDIESPIVLLYKEDTELNKDPKKDVDKFIGFNLRGISQIRFWTYKELMDKLTERLEVYFRV